MREKAGDGGWERGRAGVGGLEREYGGGWMDMKLREVWGSEGVLRLDGSKCVCCARSVGCDVEMGQGCGV